MWPAMSRFLHDALALDDAAELIVVAAQSIAAAAAAAVDYDGCIDWAADRDSCSIRPESIYSSFASHCEVFHRTAASLCANDCKLRAI